MRTPGENAMAAPVYQSATSQFRITLQCQVTTSYYGGGVEAGAGDPLVPFRPSAIRGMLRWFWRATRGGQFATYQELKAKEDFIWGSTDRASRITVNVAKAELGRGVVAKRRENDRMVFEQPAYALFPAQSDVARTIYKGGRFELQIGMARADVKDLAEDVDAALRHWLCFGGVGARTRRGLGSLYCPDYSGPTPFDLRAFLGDGKQREWSTCKGAQLVMGKAMAHQDAWVAAIEQLQKYRQMRFRPRGRSRWPEPDALRRLRGERAPHHDQDVTQGDIYPRAGLGLPVIYHFKTPGDPSPDNTLTLDADHDRFASPVVAKAMAINATQSIPILLAYNTPPPPSTLLLTRRNTPSEFVSRGDWDVIGPLLRTAAQEWRTEVYTL